MSVYEEEFKKNFEIFNQPFKNLLLTFPSKLDNKKAFFLGYLTGKLQKGPYDLIELYEFVNGREEFSSTKMLLNIQNEEEKQYLSEKKEIIHSENLALFQKTKKELPFSKEAFHSHEMKESLPLKGEKSMTNDENTCNICLSCLFEQPMHFLDNCPHIFHTKCLQSYVVEEVI